MKIKNNQQFISDIIGDKSTTINPLERSTPLLEKLIGGGNTAKGHIKRIANFADNATQQLIFELLQNADDANNDKTRKGIFQIAFNDKYFLAINNGKPFTTDTSGEPGSLKRFLSWDVRGENNESYTGKYGKGSKLLYNLFIDETDTYNDDEEKRVDAIYNNHNGPIIFSWSDINGIEDLKAFDKNTNTENKDYNDDNYPLLTKLINTYYPACPNEIHKNSKEDVNLFSSEEIAELSNFLKEYLKPDPNFVWDRGTLIFIKLGKGQNKKLEFKYEDGTRSYLSFSKNMSFVKLNDTVIRKEKLQTTGEIEVNKHKYEIAFPLPERINDVSFVNFYNLLPVLKENHGFKFIINTKAFSIQENRQNIDFSNSYNKRRLDDVVSAIEKYFQNKDIDFTHKANLYNAILLSGKEKIKKNELKEFYKNLIDLLKRHIPCKSQFVGKSENVKINTTGLNINLAELGLADYFWLNDSLLPYSDKVKDLLDIEEWDIRDILEYSDKDKIKEWIQNLSKGEYKEFIEEIDKYSNLEFAKQTPIIKSSNNEVYSINEYIQSNDKILLTPTTLELKKVFNNLKIITSHKLFVNISEKLIKKDEELQKVINVFNENKTQIHRYDKWKIIEILKAKFPDSLISLSDKLEIFKNTEGEYMSLNKMVSSIDGYAPYDLFEFLKIEEAENDGVLDGLFISESKVWVKIITDWESTILTKYKSNPDTYFQNAQEIYNTLLKIYEKSSSSSTVDRNIQIFLTTEGEFVKRSEIFINSSLSIFHESESEYEELITVFDQTGISLPPYHLISDFQKKPFGTKEKKSSISDFTSRIENKIIVSSAGLNVLRKLINDMGEVFFDHFIIQIDNGKYKLIRKENDQTQYYCTDNSVNDFLESKANYFLLPYELETGFNEYDGLVDGKSQDFVQRLINEFGSEEAFIDIVLKQGTEIVLDYIFKLRIDLKSGKEYGKTSFESKIIQHCLNNNLVDDIKLRIFVDDKKLDHYEYLDEVMIIARKFSLSELLPKYKGISKVISNVKANLKVTGKHKLITSKIKPIEDIFQEIDGTNLNLVQLSFAVAYHIDKDIQEWKYSDKGDGLNNIEKLNEFFEKELDYKKYLQIGDFNPEIQIFTNNSKLLTEEEKLPKWVNEWIEGYPNNIKKKITYLTKTLGLADGNNKVVGLRKKLNKDKHTNHSIFKEIDNKIDNKHLINTIKWAKENLKSIKYESNTHKAITELIEHCLNQCDYFEYALFFNGFENDDITLKIRKQEKGKYYISKSEYLNKIEKSEDPTFEDIMLLDINTDELKPKLKDFDKYELTIEKEFAEKEKKEVSEWDAKFYKRWKDDKAVEYKGIFLSESNLPFNYILKSKDGDINKKLGNWPDGDVALDEENKEIFISKSLIEGNDVISVLENNIDRLFESNNEKEQLRLLYKYERDELKGNGTIQGENNATEDENIIKVDKEKKNDIISIIKTGTDLTQLTDIAVIAKTIEIEKIKKIAQQLKEEQEDFEFRKKIGEAVERAFMEAFASLKLPYKITYQGKGSQDVIITNQKNKKSFFIEIKSLSPTNRDKSLKLAVSQATKAVKQISEGNYAVSVLIRPSNWETATSEFIKNNLISQLDIGQHLKRVVDKDKAFEQLLTSANGINLTFENTRRKVKVPEKIWRQNGQSFNTLIDKIKVYLG